MQQLDVKGYGLKMLADTLTKFSLSVRILGAVRSSGSLVAVRFDSHFLGSFGSYRCNYFISSVDMLVYVL